MIVVGDAYRTSVGRSQPSTERSPMANGEVIHFDARLAQAELKKRALRLQQVAIVAPSPRRELEYVVQRLTDAVLAAYRDAAKARARGDSTAAFALRECAENARHLACEVLAELDALAFV
jgi:hypothetical protein